MARPLPLSLRPAFGARYSCSSQVTSEKFLWIWVQKEPLLKQPVAKAGGGSFRWLQGTLETFHCI